VARHDVGKGAAHLEPHHSKLRIEHPPKNLGQHNLHHLGPGRRQAPRTVLKGLVHMRVGAFPLEGAANAHYGCA
jgi:hypothetical protein